MNKMVVCKGKPRQMKEGTGVGLMWEIGRPGAGAGAYRIGGGVELAASGELASEAARARGRGACEGGEAETD